MKPNPKRSLAQQVEQARMYVLEQALVAFTEDVDGRVPNDEEILREGVHLMFAPTPLSVYEKDGQSFDRYFCWRRKHVVALGFLSPKDPTVLSIVRVPEDKWPAAVKLALDQRERRPDV